MPPPLLTCDPFTPYSGAYRKPAGDISARPTLGGDMQLCLPLLTCDPFTPYSGAYRKPATYSPHTHTHTPTENNTPDTDTHTHDWFGGLFLSCVCVYVGVGGVVLCRCVCVCDLLIFSHPTAEHTSDLRPIHTLQRSIAEACRRWLGLLLGATRQPVARTSRAGAAAQPIPGGGRSCGPWPRTRRSLGRCARRYHSSDEPTQDAAGYRLYGYDAWRAGSGSRVNLCSVVSQVGVFPRHHQR